MGVGKRKKILEEIKNMNYGIISNYVLYLKYMDLFKEHDEDEYDDIEKDIENWAKGSYIAFSIILGLGNMTVSVILKEFVISVMNILNIFNIKIYKYNINPFIFMK